MKRLFDWLVTVLICWTRAGHGLVMRGLEGPTRSVTRGTDIILHCRYDLEAGDRLYAVKWFHGTREFYRFQPELQPPARSFPIEDVYVDVESSNAEKLVIRHVVPGTSGIYRCEVSAEDTFETDYREMNITIEDTPLGDPVIYNIQSRYAVGGELRINCSSFDSRPAAKLQWLINGQLKDDEDVTHYPTRRTPSPTGGPSLETSTVGLHIKRLTGEHFTADGHLTVVCTASLGSSYRRSSTVKAVADEAKGPIVNPLRPSTVSTAVTADKRRSAHQQSTGGCTRLAPDWAFVISTVLLLASYHAKYTSI